MFAFGCGGASPAPTTPEVTRVDVTPVLAPVPVIVTRDDPPRRATPPHRRYAFEGTWKSGDGAIWKLTDTSFYLHFNHNGADRENFGHILEVDEANGHFIIAYDRSIEDGHDVKPPGDRAYVTYVIEGDTIRKWVQSAPSYHEASDEKFYRVDDAR